MDTAKGIVTRINRACLAASGALIVAATLLTLWEVLTRYLLRQPAMWTFPITSYMLLYLVMLAAPYALQAGSHVSVEVVVELLPPGVQRWTQRLAHVLGLAFILVFLHQAVLYAQRVIRDGQRDTSVLSIPLWVPAAVLVFGLLAMAVTYVLVLAESIQARPSPSEQEGLALRAGLDVD